MRVNKTDLAKKLGITKQRITVLVKQGKLIFEEDGKLDLELARKQFAETQERVVTKKVTSQKNEVLNDEGESDTLVFYKTQTEKYKSLISEIELKKKRGELLNYEDVKQDAYKIGRKLHDSLLSIPERISNIIAVESDPLVIRNLLLVEIKATLNQIADDIEKV